MVNVKKGGKQPKKDEKLSEAEPIIDQDDDRKTKKPAAKKIAKDSEVVDKKARRGEKAPEEDKEPAGGADVEKKTNGRKRKADEKESENVKETDNTSKKSKKDEEPKETSNVKDTKTVADKKVTENETAGPKRGRKAIDKKKTDEDNKVADEEQKVDEVKKVSKDAKKDDKEEIPIESGDKVTENGPGKKQPAKKAAGPKKGKKATDKKEDEEMSETTEEPKEEATKGKAGESNSDVKQTGDEKAKSKLAASKKVDDEEMEEDKEVITPESDDKQDKNSSNKKQTGKESADAKKGKKIAEKKEENNEKESANDDEPKAARRGRPPKASNPNEGKEKVTGKGKKQETIPEEQEDESDDGEQPQETRRGRGAKKGKPEEKVEEKNKTSKSGNEKETAKRQPKGSKISEAPKAGGPRRVAKRAKPESEESEASESADEERMEIDDRKQPKTAQSEAEPPNKKARMTLVNHLSHRTKAGFTLTVGMGEMGQLGLGPDIMERGKPSKVNLPSDVVQVCAGGMHTVCVTVDGTVYTFGCNDEGALGRATSEEDECMEPGKVELPEKIRQVSAGDGHTAALSETGQVFIWGTFRDENNSIGVIPGRGAKQERPEKVLSNVVVVKIASGNDHLVCLTDKGDIYTLGVAHQGQLGRIAERSAAHGGRKGVDIMLTPGLVHCKPRTLKFTDIWAGQYVTFAKAKRTGEIYAFGLNNFYQLGFPDMKNRFVPEKSATFDKTKDWKEISGGQHHTMALDKDGLVYSMGCKEYGRLGLGSVDLEEKSTPTLVTSLQAKKCVNVNCGTNVSFAVDEDGKVYGWGMGSTKQLGQGNDEDDAFEPKHITGKQLTDDMRGLMVSSGGQHTVILAQNRS